MEPAATAPRRAHFIRWALMLGIVVVLNVFFSVLIALALPAPSYDVFCPAAAKPMVSPSDIASCDAAGGAWVAYPSAYTTPEGITPKAAGYCDLYAKCQKPFQSAQEQRALYAFVAMIALGAASLILGLLPLGSSIVGSGLSYGGVLALIIGSAQYWGTAGAWLRLAIAAAALAALLYIGIRRFQD